MAAGDVGRKVTFHGEHGKQIGFVADYEAGRDQGDHLLWLAPNARSVHAGGSSYGETRWSVEGHEEGAFEFV